MATRFAWSRSLQPQKAAFLQSFGNSLPPIGYVTFCREHEAECKPSGPIVDRMQLTAQKRADLEQVNRYVNQSVSPVTDLDLYGKVEVWTYPVGQGRLRGLCAAQAPHADRARLA